MSIRRMHKHCKSKLIVAGIALLVVLAIAINIVIAFQPTIAAWIIARECAGVIK